MPFQAKDISTVDSATATFRLVDDVQPWEVPIEGAALPENPVPFASTPAEHSSFGFGSSPVLGNGHAGVSHSFHALEQGAFGLKEA